MGLIILHSTRAVDTILFSTHYSSRSALSWVCARHNHRTNNRSPEEGDSARIRWWFIRVAFLRSHTIFAFQPREISKSIFIIIHHAEQSTDCVYEYEINAHSITRATQYGIIIFNLNLHKTFYHFPKTSAHTSSWCIFGLDREFLTYLRVASRSHL